MMLTTRPEVTPGPVAPFDAVRDRFRGAIVGLAVGDALGATVEFKKRGSFPPPTDLVGGGPFRLAPGEWTDDTSQALCLAASLIARGSFDPIDCMTRLGRWKNVGYMSVTGECFDIGPSTLASLTDFGASGYPYQGCRDRDTNGALMRLAPVPLAYAGRPADALRYAELSTRLTHGGVNAISASRYLAAMLVGAVAGPDPERVLGLSGSMYVPPGVRDRDWYESISGDVRRVAEGRAAGPVRAGLAAVECLHAALWAVRSAASLEDAIMRAAALGEDSDTAAAVAGQLAGAIWGYRAIPTRWVKTVAWHDRLVAAADGLYDLSGLNRASRLAQARECSP